MKLDDIKDKIPKNLYNSLLPDIEELRPAQEKSIKAGLLDRKNLLVCTPTASGKCMHYDSRVLLADGSLAQIGNLYNNIPKELYVLSLDEKNLKIKKKKVSKIYKIYHNKPLLEIKTGLGNSIKVTPEHPFLVKRNSNLKWIRADNLKKRDFIIVPRITKTFSKEYKFDKEKMILSFSRCYVNNRKLLEYLLKKIKRSYREIAVKLNVDEKDLYRWRKRTAMPLDKLIQLFRLAKIDSIFSKINYVSDINGMSKLKLPLKVTENMSRLLGLMIADGSIHYKKSCAFVSFTNVQKELREEFSKICNEDFNISSKTKVQSFKSPQEIVNSKIFCELLMYLGIPSGKKSSKVKVPSFIFHQPKIILSLFLSALFDCDGSIYDKGIEYSTDSRHLIFEIQNLLLRFGIVSIIKKRFFKGKNRYRLFIYRKDNLKLFKEKIGFKHNLKKKRLDNWLKNKGESTNIDVIPFINQDFKNLRTELNLNIKDMPVSFESYIYGWRKNISYFHLKNFVSEYIKDIKKPTARKLKILSEAHIYFDRITDIRITKPIKCVYDMTVPGTNNFIAENIIVHNTLIAELGMVKSILENKGKAIYIVPLKALANEKFKDFKKRYGTYLRIALSIGDLDSADNYLAGYDLVICTSEKLDSLIRHGGHWIKLISTVVVDECLPYDIPVLLSNNLLIKIGKLVESVPKKRVIERQKGYYYISKNNNYVLSYNLRYDCFEPRKIIGYWKLKAPKYYYVIKTRDGDSIKLTENHPLLTNNTKRWTYAKNLKKGMFVALKKNSPIEKKKGNKIIINKKDIIETYNNKQKYFANLYFNVLRIRNEKGFGARIISRKLKANEGTIKTWINKPKKTPTSIRVVKRLENKNLLPLKESNPQLIILCRIIGHLFGDDWIYKKGRTIGFSGKYVDLQVIKKDLSSLGFKSGKIFKRNTRSRINTVEGVSYNVEGTTTSFHSGDSSLLHLLLALGVPQGNKTNKEFCIPKWIMEAPLSLKKEFLSAWMGSEGSEINFVKNSRRVEAIRVRFNKIEKLKDNILFFADQIKKLFNSFEINIIKITVKKANIRKDGSRSIQVSLTISNSNKNIKMFIENIGYTYCMRKGEKANLVLKYLTEKQNRTKELKEIRKKVMLLRKKEKIGPKNIVEKLNLPGYFLNTVQNWIYHGRNIKVSINFPTFQEWIKTQNPNNAIEWSEIASIKKIECKDEYVYDIEVEKTHNFIANNMIVRNCHLLNDPGRGPTLEILITMLRELLENVQIIALSATIGNPAELSEWLNANIVIDNWRPVELKKGIFYKGELEFEK
jgi:intein/homing endonuclease